MSHMVADVVAGGVAGLVATAPMTLVMEALRQRLPRTERHALPPQLITLRASRKAGMRRHLRQHGQRTGVTIAAHFLYGGAVGALYVPLMRATGLPPLASGLGYGLVVWLVSYLGLLPAARLFPPPTRVAPRRTALMIVAHLVWGAALGILSGPRQDAAGGQR